MNKEEKDICQNLFNLMDNIQEDLEDMVEKNKVSTIGLEMVVSRIKSMNEKAVILKYINQKQLEEPETNKIDARSLSTHPPDEVMTDPIESSENTNLENHVLEEMKELNVDHFESTLHENVSNSPTQNDQSSRFMEQPISDLPKSIGLNEKYIFVNELFGGNVEVYESNIKLLNGCKNYSEALELINTKLSNSYGWDADQNTVKIFMSLIEKRYRDD